MDLSLSEEQRLLGDAAGRFIAGRYSFEQRRAILQIAEGFSRDIWREFADLGWLGLSVPEEFGGLGAGAVETGIVMEALGRALVVEPYLATAVISARPDRRARLAAAEIRACCRQLPKASRCSPSRMPSRRRASRSTTSRPWRRARATAGTSQDARISCWVRPGRTRCWSPRASPGSQRDRAGIGVFVVPAKSAGLSTTALSNARWRARRQHRRSRMSRAADCIARRQRERAARDREGGRQRDRGDGVGGRRLHAGAARDDDRLHQAAHPVRQAACRQSGAAPPHGVDGREDRRGARERAQRDPECRCRSA